MEYVYNVSIVCGLIKTKILSQEIFHKERIPAGSHEENYALVHRISFNYYGFNLIIISLVFFIQEYHFKVSQLSSSQAGLLYKITKVFANLISLCCRKFCQVQAMHHCTALTCSNHPVLLTQRSTSSCLLKLVLRVMNV